MKSLKKIYANTFLSVGILFEKIGFMFTNKGVKLHIKYQTEFGKHITKIRKAVTDFADKITKPQESNTESQRLKNILRGDNESTSETEKTK